MDPDQFSLSLFEVDCDGSACGSGPTERHIHPVQRFDAKPLGRVRVTNSVRSYPTPISIPEDTCVFCGTDHRDADYGLTPCIDSIIGTIAARAYIDRTL